MSGQIETDGSLTLFREQAARCDLTTIEGVGRLVMLAAENTYAQVGRVTRLSRPAITRCAGGDLPAHLVMQRLLWVANMDTVLYEHTGPRYRHTSLRTARTGVAKDHVIDLTWQAYRVRPHAETHAVPPVLFAPVEALPDLLDQYDVSRVWHSQWMDAVPSPLTYTNSGLSGFEPIFRESTLY